jgi:hypothetical protein
MGLPRKMYRARKFLSSIEGRRDDVVELSKIDFK